MSGRAAWLLRIARPELGRILLAAVFGSAAHGCAIALAATSGWLIARAAEQPPVLALIVAVTAVRACGIGRAVLRYVQRLVGHDAAFRVMARTRLRVYLALERAGPAHSQRIRRGSLLTRLLDDVQAVQDLFVRAVLPALVLGLGTVAATVGTALLSPIFGVVLLGGMLLGIAAAAYVTIRVTHRAERTWSETREELATPTVELLHGLPDLEACRASGSWLGRIARTDARLSAAGRRVASGLGLADAVVLLTLGATVLTQLVLGVAAVRAGSVPGTWLPVLVLVPIVGFELVGWTPELVRHFSRGTRAIERLRQLEELPRTPVGDGLLAVPRSIPELTVDDVTVRWPSAPSPALTGVSLTLSPGKRIGIVGGSGVGKTTLLNAMLGFLPTEHGAVRLDGVALPELASESVRAAVVCCGQEAVLFDNTIRKNLLLARPDAEDEQLLRALREVRLADWIASLPDGLDTQVGERGVRVSGGERQRLALARALLADPGVLLLDEPTAYLDESTAAELMRDLLVVTAGRSTVLVTHRLAGLSVVDEVLVLGQPDGAHGVDPASCAPGTVVQCGAPMELMRTPGPYREMWLCSAASAAVAGYG